MYLDLEHLVLHGRDLGHCVGRADPVRVHKIPVEPSKPERLEPFCALLSAEAGEQCRVDSHGGIGPFWAQREPAVL